MSQIRDPVRGDKHLVAALKALSKGLPDKDVDASVKEAVEPMHKAAVSNIRAHRQPGRRPKGGHLDENFVFRKQGRMGRVKRYVLGAVRRARALLHLVEWGTRPHEQRRRGIFHPGARAFRPVTRAFDETAEQVSPRFGRAYAERFEALVKRLSAGAPARRR